MEYTKLACLAPMLETSSQLKVILITNDFEPEKENFDNYKGCI